MNMQMPLGLHVVFGFSCFGCNQITVWFVYFILCLVWLARNQMLWYPITFLYTIQPKIDRISIAWPWSRIFNSLFLLLSLPPSLSSRSVLSCKSQVLLAVHTSMSIHRHESACRRCPPSHPSCRGRRHHRRKLCGTVLSSCKPQQCHRSLLRWRSNAAVP